MTEKAEWQTLLTIVPCYSTFLRTYVIILQSLGTVLQVCSTILQRVGTNLPGNSIVLQTISTDGITLQDDGNCLQDVIYYAY